MKIIEDDDDDHEDDEKGQKSGLLYNVNLEEL